VLRRKLQLQGKVARQKTKNHGKQLLGEKGRLVVAQWVSVCAFRPDPVVASIRG